jgi:hypothetical protein
VLRVVVLAAACAALLVGCGGASGPPQVSLSQLVAQQGRYDGARVRVRGRVQRFVDPDGVRYFVIEDGRDNRVQLLPPGVVGSYRGSTVEATGCFTTSPIDGRMLRVSDIVRLGGQRSQPHRSHVSSDRACRPAGAAI